MNTIYANDLNVSGTTSFASVTASGLTVNGNASVTGTLGVNSTTSLKGTNITGTLNIINTASANADTVGLVVGGNNTGNRVRIMSDGAQAISNTAASSLWLNYWGGTVYLSTGNQIHANNGTFTTPTLTATNGMINRLFVPEELRALQYNIQSINNLGGSFLIGPTINVPAGNNVSITAINTTTNVVTANISGSFSLTTFPTVIWAANSKIKISGSIGGIPIGTCDGKLRAALTTSTIQVEFTYGGQGTKPLSVANNQASVDLAVMIYTVGATNPIGIYMTSWGDTSWTDTTAQNKSSISIYGGTTSSDVAPTASTPVVRIGNLSGLPAVNGSNPVGWGIYAQHGYFSGTIVSTSGSIGGWVIESSNIHSSGHNEPTTQSNGLFIGTSQIAGGSGGTWYLKNDGTGKIGRYTFASNGALTTGTGANQAGMGGAQAFWAGSSAQDSAPFRVGYDGTFVATNATITGAITATSGTIGASNATNKITIGTNTTNASIYYGMSSLGNTTSNGFYIGTDGIALGKGAFKVTNAGALTATSATITGTITATSGTIGASNATNKITIGTDATNASIYYAMSSLETDTATGFYIGTDGISLGGGNFKVTSGGSAVFKDATLGDPSSYHIVIDNDSLDVLNSQNIVASFGEDTIIGYEDTRHLSFSQEGLRFFNAGNSKVFSIESGDMQATQTSIGKLLSETIDYTYYLSDIVPNSNITIKIYNGSSTSASVLTTISNIIQGTSFYSTSLSSSGISPIIYDGDNVITICNHSTTARLAVVSYRKYIPGETYFTFGKRDLTDQTFGNYSCVLGEYCMATNKHSYAFGEWSKATKNFAHADGEWAQALGAYSYAKGDHVIASGSYSHAEGRYSYATANYCYTIGKYNIVTSTTSDGVTTYDAGDYAFIIGNGTDILHTSNAFTVDWSGNVVASGSVTATSAAFTGNISASNFFPVNSIYITSTNTNPSTILGFGTWTLFDKHYAPTMVTDAFTLNSTNVSALSGAWVKIAEHNILIRIQFTNKVAYADGTIDVGTFNLAQIGLASGKMPWYIGSGYSDNGNAIVMPNIDGSGKVQIQDVVANGTATQIAAGSSIQLLFTITVHTIADMLDSFCNKFFWKRTA